jgi:hypothetical protein
MEDITVLVAPLELRRLSIEYADRGFDPGQIYDQLEADHPLIVDEYVLTKRRELVVQAIRMVIGQRRRFRFHRARYAAAEARLEAGENLYLALFPSVDGGSKNLVNMTKADLVYAADIRTVMARTLISESDVLRALSRRVPKGKTVGDVFSPEQVTLWLQKLTGGTL